MCWCDVCGPDGARGLGVLGAQPVSCATLPRHVGEAAVPGELTNQSVIYITNNIPTNNYEPQHEDSVSCRRRRQLGLSGAETVYPNMDHGVRPPGKRTW